MPSYLCECRAKNCRRSFELTHETYAWLRSIGAVLAPECAAREGRERLLVYSSEVVVAGTNGPRCRPPTRSL